MIMDIIFIYILSYTHPHTFLNTFLYNGGENHDSLGEKILYEEIEQIYVLYICHNSN